MAEVNRANSKSIAPNEISVFGPAPILEGENAQAYNELLARVSGDIKAKGIIGEILVKDFVDLTWEILRWRRLIAAQLSKSVEPLLPKYLGRTRRRKISSIEAFAITDISSFQTIPRSAYKLAKKWAAGDPAAVDRVSKILASKNVTMERIMADALMENLDTIERVDRLITIAEGRRNSILREIDRRRAALAENLRAIANDVEDAEFEVVDSVAVGIDEKAA